MLLLPPSELIAQKAIHLYTHLFTGISNFILNAEHYPFKMKLPEESVWVFPSNISFATQSTLANRDEWKTGVWGWDYVNGVVAEYETIVQHYQKTTGAKNSY